MRPWLGHNIFPIKYNLMPRTTPDRSKQHFSSRSICFQHHGKPLATFQYEQGFNHRPKHIRRRTRPTLIISTKMLQRHSDPLIHMPLVRSIALTPSFMSLTGPLAPSDLFQPARQTPACTVHPNRDQVWSSVNDTQLAKGPQAQAQGHVEHDGPEVRGVFFLK